MTQTRMIGKYLVIKQEATIVYDTTDITPKGFPIDPNLTLELLTETELNKWKS